MKKRSLKDWQLLAETRLKHVIKSAREFPGLARLGPKADWSVQVKMVGNTAMSRLNSDFRGKSYPTDVLSFPSPALFRKSGILGDLVICHPVLKAQAKELGHSIELELEVLLVHGVLHLLGLDHEKNKREAARMGRWELKVLQSTRPAAFSSGPLSGLIDRNFSGI